PKGDLVVRLLELTMVSASELEKVHHLRPLRHVLDAALFERILGPGQRSTVFKILSNSSGMFPDELSLHFFYINVGSDTKHPHLARVEIPAWVAIQEALLERLQFALVAQSRVLGNRPYPYAIHRAHEVAVVRMEEKDQINDMIVQEFQQLQLPTGARSNKQIAKDNFGKRTRYS
ncbi:MAG TPA: DNA double-strand break repair nuclease NurA, partial [Polyangia bacterium]